MSTLPKEDEHRVRSTRTKRCSNCTAHIRFQFLKDRWLVASVDNRHQGHSRAYSSVIDTVDDHVKEELIRRIRDDGMTIHATIANVTRTQGLYISSQEIYNMLREYDTTSQAEVKIRVGDTDINSNGQFPTLINDLSKDPDTIAFAHYCVNDSQNHSIGSFHQLYFTADGERKNILLKATSTFDLFDHLFGKPSTLPPDFLETGIEQYLHNPTYQFIPTTVCWCSYEQVTRNARFADVVMLDATGGTNSQSRPVIQLVSLDGECKNICLLTCITIDETGGRFTTVLNAFGTIYGRIVCQRVKTFFSDGDDQITDSVDSKILSGTYDHECKRFLCSWHMVNLRMIKNTCHFSKTDEFYRYIFMRYVRHAIHYCETREEFNEVLKHIRDYIDSSPLSLENKEKLREMVVYIDNKSPYICYYKRLNALTYGCHTDGRVESENNALKRYNVTPRSRLSQLYRADLVRQTLRETNYRRRDQYIMNSVPILPGELRNSLPTETIETLHQLTSAGCAYMTDILQQASSGYYCVKASDGIYLVQHKNYSKTITLDITDDSLDLSHNLRLPRFQRVRKIVARTTDNNLVLECSCQYHKQWGLPCSHIVFINRCTISRQQLTIRWMKAYTSMPLTLQAYVETFPEKIYFSDEDYWLKCVAPPNDHPLSTSTINTNPVQQTTCNYRQRVNMIINYQPFQMTQQQLNSIMIHPPRVNMKQNSGR